MRSGKGFLATVRNDMQFIEREIFTTKTRRSRRLRIRLSPNFVFFARFVVEVR